MADFSLELAAKRIYDPRSRELFTEVLSCYSGGNYRSAVVGLWSVAVADMLYKLDHLKLTYEDSVATKLLQQIEQAQQNNPYSPIWERQLLELIKAETHLLDHAEYANLNHLRDHRNLCAHPVLTLSRTLFTPTPDQARAHLRNVLDGLLAKPPVFTKHVFSALMEDLSEKKTVLSDGKALSRYLHAQYFNFLPPKVEDQVFRNTWKFVFRLKNEQCEQNREINYRLLELLSERRPDAIRELIRNEVAYYSQVSTDISCLEFLIMYLFQRPDVFELLDDGAKVILRSVATRSLNDFARAWYLSKSFSEHLQEIRRRIVSGEPFTTGDGYEGLILASENEGLVDDALVIGIEALAISSDSTSADFRFGRFVSPYLERYDSRLMETLLRAIEKNSQIYSSDYFSAGYQSVRTTAARLLGDAFNQSEYPHVFLAFGE